MSSLDSQVDGSAHSSLLLPSEPPDIRKWFSSYTYQSPVLDTHEDFGDALRVDEEDTRLYVEDSENEEKENWKGLTKIRNPYRLNNQDGVPGSVIGKSSEGSRMDSHPPVAEVSAYHDSLTLPSEPQDIRNWFSRYEYESPALDSADFDVALSSGCDFENIKELYKEREEGLKELTGTYVRYEPSLRKETILNSCSTIPRSVGNSKKHFDGLSNCSLEKDYIKGSYLPSTNCCCPEKASALSTRATAWENALLVCQEGQQMNLADCLTSPSKSPHAKDFKERDETKNERKLLEAENDGGWIFPNHRSSEIDPKYIKNDYTAEYISAENRDTSLRKKASSKIDENSLNQLEQPSKCEYNRNVNPASSIYARKDGVVRREALNEMTNFPRTYDMEVAGKWRCPQRSKPDIGPPLKQLRLERWVHRI